MPRKNGARSYYSESQAQQTETKVMRLQLDLERITEQARSAASSRPDGGKTNWGSVA